MSTPRVTWARIPLALGAALAGLLLLAAPPAPAGQSAPLPALRADRACPATAQPAPRPATLAGCRQAWCAGRGASARCVCQPTSDDAAVRWVYRPAGTAQPAWPAEVSPMLGPEAFELWQAELDGDGRPDTVLVQHQSVSNGMAVSLHRLCVWRSTRPAAAPVCREVEDWGSLTRLVQPAGEGLCALLAGDWRGGTEPRRGDGLYAVGQLWRLGPDGWRADAGRPLVARRYTRVFERERGQAPKRSALWYQHPSARTLRCPDPLCLPKATD
jgi:hypothetical protein